MPELPEVETVKRSLEPLVVGRAITCAKLTHPNLLKNALPDQFAQELRGRKICALKRRGKYLIFELSNDYTLIVHLRMTGQLRHNYPGEPLLKHTHVVLSLSDDMELRFVDVRKFGMIFIGAHDKAANDAGLHRLGPEPLSDDFSPDYLYRVLRNTRRSIKAVLLDQNKVAGLGNIYVDESLFRAGIHPESASCCIPKESVVLLTTRIKEVLLDGIAKRGTSINDYVDGFGRRGSFQFELNVYRRTGEQCHQCEHTISRCVVAGRGTHVCLNCQTKYQ